MDWKHPVGCDCFCKQDNYEFFIHEQNSTQFILSIFQFVNEYMHTWVLPTVNSLAAAKELAATWLANDKSNPTDTIPISDLH
jgi:hypothetical protein